LYRIYCLLLASVAGPVLMKSTTQRFSLRPQNRLYLLNVTKPPIRPNAKIRQAIQKLKGNSMGILRISLLIVGFLAALLGLIWVGQGTGYFPYPASSFMINQSSWIWRGAILALTGLVVIVGSRRI
jgi:hypothetical protein